MIHTAFPSSLNVTRVIHLPAVMTNPNPTRHHKSSPPTAQTKSSRFSVMDGAFHEQQHCAHIFPVKSKGIANRWYNNQAW